MNWHEIIGSILQIVQLITMPVGGEDFDGMAMAYASGKQIDVGDSDVFQTSMSRRQIVSGSLQRSMTEVRH